MSVGAPENAIGVGEAWVMDRLRRCQVRDPTGTARQHIAALDYSNTSNLH